MNVMRIGAVALLSLASAGVVAGQSAKESAGAEKLITGTLHQMYEAEKRRDLAFVLAHLGEDFAEVAGDGLIYHRSDIEAEWANVVLNDYELTDCVFKLMTRDTAYLSCKMKVDAVFKGQSFPDRLRVTTFWTREKGKWLIRFEQETILPAPAAGK
jgi:hypothetical protein